MVSKKRKSLRENDASLEEKQGQETGVINNPLGQTSLVIYFAIFSKVSMDGRTTCEKTIITTGRDRESASWINTTTTKV